MSKAAVRQRAEDVLRRHLQPGEHVAVSAAVTSDPPRSGVVILLIVAVALTAAGVAIMLGPLPGGPVMLPVLPVLVMGIEFLPSPVYVAVTDRRQICCRLSRLRGAPGRLLFAVPLADLRVVGYRSGRHWSSIRCAIPGRKPIRLAASRGWHRDFAQVELALAGSGAFAGLDPPWPSRGQAA
jgi:hypothetical protein